MTTVKIRYSTHPQSIPLRLVSSRTPKLTVPTIGLLGLKVQSLDNHVGNVVP